MMINKRLIHTVAESKKYIAGNVAFQWFALLGNIAMCIDAALSGVPSGGVRQIDDVSILVSVRAHMRTSTRSPWPKGAVQAMG